MRYYRLWIYTCNLVLLGSALGFVAAISRTLLFTSDPRRYLVPGVPRAYDPTALYAYLALATQLGLVQLVGCIAARRLSERLLMAYWALLLALLFGDAVIGVAWVFRFETMRAELRPTLRQRLQMEYGKDLRFSEQWDRLQKEFTCCGVTGPRDFGARWPQTCCGSSTNVSDTCQQPYARGCEDQLFRWLRKTADLLFVLGFCVIAFVKLCFLGILWYEIREMIQKIGLLRKSDDNGSIARRSTLPNVVTPSGNASFLLQTDDCGAGRNPLLANNLQDGGVDSDTNSHTSIVPRTTLSHAVTLPGNASLLLQTDDCNAGRLPLLANNLQDGGADSDTNSHSALILEETTPTSMNHNCNAREKSNGNNNYEMREFNRRSLLSNGGSSAAGITTAGQNRRT
ncbi:CD63 antigen [Dufourea novaeangliae]|uniref:CD63 antigen n=1 Tax=Dufourea novaeangliae TaxID=178035 RepID=A0A154P675_DUFNO|nr:CD63 antigen [Dufourea novaeangliae]